MSTATHDVVRHMDCHLGIEVEDHGRDAGDRRFRAWLTVDRIRTGASVSAADARQAEDACRQLLADRLTALLAP